MLARLVQAAAWVVGDRNAGVAWWEKRREEACPSPTAPKGEVLLAAAAAMARRRLEDWAGMGGLTVMLELMFSQASQGRREGAGQGILLTSAP